MHYQSMLNLSPGGSATSFMPHTSCSTTISFYLLQGFMIYLTLGCMCARAGAHTDSRGLEETPQARLQQDVAQM